MIRSTHGLDAFGLAHAEQHWNLTPAALVEAAVRSGEGKLTNSGPFHAVTTPHTGRSPNDRFLVREASTAEDVWWGNANVALEDEQFSAMRADVQAYLGQSTLYVMDVYACADAENRLKVRVISEGAWQSLFVHNMFLQPLEDDLKDFRPDVTVLHAPRMGADNQRHGTRTKAGIVLNLGERTVLIVGTRYAGEIKKSIFSVLNYFLPGAGVLPMHCSANVGEDGETAIFFGLSGTGKTTLSAVANRGLIGDDEHGWSDSGVFNFEGGCYAKVIRLSPEAEPEIFATLSRFGTILENVDMDANTREFDLDSAIITENTRASYPIQFIPNHVRGGQGRHPRNVLFLTADAFGVLPPISRLTPEQAMYHFLSGYTAKVAGTERGVSEPEATFSACFGAPFLVLHPSVYSKMLGEKMRKHGTAAWLVNTGWSGGAYGVGARMEIAYTRAMVDAALEGELAKIKTEEHPVFGVNMPVKCPGVPAGVLNPRDSWTDKDAYDKQALDLAARFVTNFAQFADGVSAEVVAAGPKV